MPIYEYKCDSCGKQFELIRPHSAADSPHKCEFCKSNQTKRILSSFFSCSGKSSSNADSGCAGCSGRNCSTCS